MYDIPILAIGEIQDLHVADTGQVVFDSFDAGGEGLPAVQKSCVDRKLAAFKAFVEEKVAKSVRGLALWFGISGQVRLDAQLEAAEALYQNSVRLAEMRGGRSTAEDAYISQLANVILAMQEISATDEAAARAQAAKVREAERNLAALQQEATLQSAIAEFGADSAEVQLLRRERAWEAYAAKQAELGVSQQQLAVEREIFDQANRITAPTDKTAEARLRDLTTAESMLVTLTEQNAIASATLKFGADSAQVAELQADAQRRVLEEQLAALDVTEDKKDALRAALENAIALSRVDMATGIGNAAARADFLAARLGVALSVANALNAAMNADAGIETPPEGGLSFGLPAMEDPSVGSARLGFGRLGRGPRRYVQPLPEPVDLPGGGRRGGGGRAAREEADAVADLIARLREEIELQRETDPVRQEMLKHREVLAAATDAERAAVEDLIATREREAAETAALNEQRELFTDTAFDAIRALTMQGAELADVMDNVANAILNAVLQATLLGEGPLAGLLGFTGGGGLLGTLAEALFPKAGAAIPAKADGGYLTGPGGGTSDDILMWGSSGEFMVNAKATARHRHLLEALNAGAPIARFASGGFIGPAGGGASGGGDAPTIVIDNRGTTPVRGEVVEEPGSGSRRRFRLILADEVGAAMTTKGGGARRALTGAYDVRPKGTRR